MLRMAAARPATGKMMSMNCAQPMRGRGFRGGRGGGRGGFRGERGGGRGGFGMDMADLEATRINFAAAQPIMKKSKVKDFCMPIKKNMEMEKSSAIEEMALDKFADKSMAK